MQLNMGRVLSMEPDQTTSSATEYRERFMSPRREDYTPHVVLPKVGPDRPPSNRSFLSFDINPNATAMNASEYRLCFENYHPKRPYVFHAQPSHVFDYVPKPIVPRATSRLSATPSLLKDTEYQERYPNYRSFIPTQELLPPHLTGKPNTQSDTQQKKDRMTRSQYFHELVIDSEKLNGGQRQVGGTEQRTAFRWPYQYPPSPPPKTQQKEAPAQVYPPYYTPRNIYEPLPPITRPVINAFN